jgi:hypothetical protein
LQVTRNNVRLNSLGGLWVLESDDAGTAVAQRQTVVFRHPFLFALNVAAGVVLWFGMLTDVSWAGGIADLVFPPLVVVLALASWRVSYSEPVGRARRLFRIACMPALIGGAATMLAIALLIVPPFTLGLLFAAGEAGQQQLIQSTVSPNGMQVANVYFTGVGAYSGGNGRVSVAVSPRWMPLVERDLYYEGASDAGLDTTRYVRWDGNDTLAIVGEPELAPGEHVHVGLLRPEVPTFIAIPVNLIESARQFAE